MAKTFYPSYIPKKWIHYSHHKKRRIRKKYQNRIWREALRHKADLQTLSFLLADAATKYSGGSWCSGSATGLFARTIPVPSFPRLVLPQITVPKIENPEIPEAMQEAMRDALEKLVKSIVRLGEELAKMSPPIIEWLTKTTKKLSKWSFDFWDRLWCKNKHWWYMAEHHKKHRIRKKYRNKIKHEARRHVGELLELLTTDDSEDDETASDDEEGL